MGRLKDCPAGTISPHDLACGAEAPELAALPANKCRDGFAGALPIAGLDSAVRSGGDRLVREIDPVFDERRRACWAAHPESLALNDPVAG